VTDYIKTTTKGETVSQERCTLSQALNTLATSKPVKVYIEFEDERIEIVRDDNGSGSEVRSMR